MVADETTLHKRPNDTEISYRSSRSKRDTAGNTTLHL